MATFTEEAKFIYSRAAELAIKEKNMKVEQIHIFYSAVTYCNAVNAIVAKMGIDRAHLSNNIMNSIHRLPSTHYPFKSDIRTFPITQSTQNIKTYASNVATELKSNNILGVHILIAICEHPDSDVAPLINEYGLNRSRIVSAASDTSLTTTSSTTSTSSSNMSGSKESTDNSIKIPDFAEDLVEKYKRIDADPIIGREAELRVLMQTLSRKTKNNPCLIGEPGVGKTAVVEALAQRIAKGDVPDSLKNKKLLSVDISAMLAGARYVGDTEERVQTLLNYFKQDCGKSILFIDEIHNIVGAGKGDGGGQDVSNMLKPMLARGELHCIGATTLDEYHKYIEKDPALERRFQTVMVNEPSIDDAISILRGLKEKYEIFHGVKIMDDALVSAVTLSARYISDRRLPDKALDLIDEACALIKNQLNTMPVEVDEVSRRIVQLGMEEAAVSKEEPVNRTKLEHIRRDLASARAEYEHLQTQWETEKNAVENVSRLRATIDAMNSMILKSQENNDIEMAAALKYTELPILQKQLEEAESLISDHGTMIREKVTVAEIEQAISRQTGIPLTKLSESERDKVLHLPEDLHKRVIGQDEAVNAISKAILRNKAGLSDPNKPIGSFLFLGPTGVGKTELAKSLAESLFDSASNMIRFDMSEFYDKYTVSRLIGSTPGYVGYEEGGQLTEAVRRRPYSVVLFDEVEKADPSIFNIFLQILDEGHLTDGQGKKVSFKNTVIIMTSNIGAEYLLDSMQNRGCIDDEALKNVNNALLKHFRPEIVNRLDAKVIFKPLSKDNIAEIARLTVYNIAKRLSDRNVFMEFTDTAMQFAIDNGYNPAFGARPLKRFLQDNAEIAVATLIMEQDLHDCTVEVDVVNNEYIANIKEVK